MKEYPVFVLVALLLIIGCKENEPTPPERSRTFLHILNGAEIDTFNLKLDYFNADDVVINDFHYQRNFPIKGYADMQAGGSPDQFGNGKLFVTLSRQPFANIEPDTIMQPEDVILDADEKSTIAFADSFGTIKLLKYKDDYTLSSDTIALVRFINLSSVFPLASIASSDGKLNISNVPFMEKSEFIQLPHGTYNVELKDTAGAVIANNQLWLSGQTAYSFYMSGTSPDLGFFTH